MVENPSAELVEKGDEVHLAKPWNDSSAAFVVNDELVNALEHLILPSSFNIKRGAIRR